MNPYEANVWNVSSRLGAWLRGLLRLYRRPLLVLLCASVTTAVGVSAGQSGTPDRELAGTEMAALLDR
ncbi:hypothetical protein FHS79_003714 [Polymorphobacter multimanifer]|uniref:Uncharacterized protein n=1 Tax=Polymorphobacter multimanifer TaxID=1070431 RepID=A0A841LCR4_9SPHN|nr:hypothetical protein [Polymorphobacter multimanifer]MBB6229511.1 hypothetical protein [Polymorphobacter multimanifer]